MNRAVSYIWMIGCVIWVVGGLNGHGWHNWMGATIYLSIAIVYANLADKELREEK